MKKSSKPRRKERKRYDGNISDSNSKENESEEE